MVTRINLMAGDEVFLTFYTSLARKIDIFSKDNIGAGLLVIEHESMTGFHEVPHHFRCLMCVESHHIPYFLHETTMAMSLVSDYNELTTMYLPLCTTPDTHSLYLTRRDVERSGRLAAKQYQNYLQHLRPKL